MNPLFVTFEGLDGSGKSTHLRQAVQWLQQREIPFLVTHEPGGTPLGRCIREAVLHPAAGPVDGRVELLLMFADRRHHLQQVVEPALAEGRHVLSDRFSDSTRAYQGGGRGVPQELIDRVDELATDRRRPDRTLLFDLSPEEARERGQSHSRQQKKGGVDRIDAEDLAFYARVRAVYLNLATKEPERFRVIDASGSRKQTWDQVEALLGEWFPVGRVEEP